MMVLCNKTVRYFAIVDQPNDTFILNAQLWKETKILDEQNYMAIDFVF